MPARVTGAARFAIDTVLPEMLYGAVVHTPHVGGRISRVDTWAASAVPRVAQVVVLCERAVTCPAVTCDRGVSRYHGTLRQTEMTEES